jgi:hypothetical protein
MKPVEELAPGLWSWTVPRGGIPQTMTALLVDQPHLQ